MYEDEDLGKPSTNAPHVEKENNGWVFFSAFVRTTPGVVYFTLASGEALLMPPFCNSETVRVPSIAALGNRAGPGRPCTFTTRQERLGSGCGLVVVWVWLNKTPCTPPTSRAVRCCWCSCRLSFPPTKRQAKTALRRAFGIGGISFFFRRA